MKRCRRILSFLPESSSGLGGAAGGDGEMKDREVWIIPGWRAICVCGIPSRECLCWRSISRWREQEVDGVIGIHWRTKDIEQNFEALGKFAAQPELVEGIIRNRRRNCGRLFTDFMSPGVKAIQPGSHRAGEVVYGTGCSSDSGAQNGQLISPEYSPYEPCGENG